MFFPNTSALPVMGTALNWVGWPIPVQVPAGTMHYEHYLLKSFIRDFLIISIWMMHGIQDQNTGFRIDLHFSFCIVPGLRCSGKKTLTLLEIWSKFQKI